MGFAGTGTLDLDRNISDWTPVEEVKKYYILTLSFPYLFYRGGEVCGRFKMPTAPTAQN